MNFFTRLSLAALVIGIPVGFLLLRKSPMHALNTVNSICEAVQIFPTSVGQINATVKAAMADAQKQIDAIIAIPDHERTYANTVKALDNATSFSDLPLFAGVLSSTENLNPNKELRELSHEKLIEIQNFFIDAITNNEDLYKAVKAYADTNAKNEDLTDEEKYYLDETIKDFERAGLNLPKDKQEHVKKLRKEISEIELVFQKNIAEANNTITVDKEGLSGLTDDFISGLQKTGDGKYILGTDYPTYNEVMDNCTNRDTREKLYVAFLNRAYPVNKKLLQDLIAKRYELAQLLGFASYAALDLDNQMVKTPRRADEFLDHLIKKSEAKAQKESKEYRAAYPTKMPLSKDNKIYGWDFGFLKNNYKKVAFNVDESKNAEYFPMEHTIKGLLSIYEKFFNLEFKQLPAQKLWDKEVMSVEVIDKNHGNQVIGYLFLDLYPRPNKYSHAAHQTIIPTTYHEDGTPNKGVSVVMANFPKSTPNKPSLLKLKDVNTFFHEFGHALHAILGRTHIASFAGTQTKTDFVEMPSQMLEEWLWDKGILKMLSHHYQTGLPMPDEMIENIVRLRTYDSGTWLARQLVFAKMALNYFNNGPSEDVEGMFKNLYEAITDYVHFDPRNHDYAAFGHLTGYGAKYYGYLWSKVFAHDLFNEIKKYGLLNPEIGGKYVNTVIGKGGSKDPNLLLKDFLGREPNDKAFLRDMGFDK